MKQSLPVPVIIGVVVVVLVVIAGVFIRGATAEPHTPRPDPAMFGGKSGPPPTVLPTAR